MGRMRYMFRSWLGVLLVVATMASTARGFEKTATTAATFLQIPVGARLTGMGGAGVAYPGGAELIALNPALVGPVQGVGVSLSHVEWFADLQHQSAALVVPISTNLSGGLHIISFGGDEFEQTTLQQQEGSGVMVEYGDLAVAAAGIARLTDRFTVGLSAKYIHQKLFHETASTFAFDIGTHLRTSLDGFSIGMSMTNLGGEMQLEGRDLYVEPGGVSGGGTRYETSAWALPLTFQTGVAWRLLGEGNAYRELQHHQLVIASDARHLNEGRTTLHLGGEYGFADTVFLRAGHVFGHDSQKWSFGGGVQVELYSYRLAADFAYADMGDLDAVQRVTLTLYGR